MIGSSIIMYGICCLNIFLCFVYLAGIYVCTNFPAFLNLGLGDAIGASTSSSMRSICSLLEIKYIHLAAKLMLVVQIVYSLETHQLIISHIFFCTCKVSTS